MKMPAFHNGHDQKFGASATNWAGAVSNVLTFDPAKKSITGTKVKIFVTTPAQFVALVPNFWSWLLWKAGIFMHNDVAILEQVSYL